MITLPDLCQTTVLSKTEWLRIQNELHQVHEERKSVLMEAERRKALHLPSVQAVNQWSNTIIVSCLYREFPRIQFTFSIWRCLWGCKIYIYSSKANAYRTCVS